MIRKLFFSLQAYIRVFSTSGHCCYTLLWVLDEFPLSWEFGSTWSAASALWISAVVKAVDAASTLSFYTHLALSSISIGCRIQATCLHWCGYSIFNWGLSCTHSLWGFQDLSLLPQQFCCRVCRVRVCVWLCRQRWHRWFITGQSLFLCGFVRFFFYYYWNNLDNYHECHDNPLNIL